jgi:hypothetical protein
MLKSLVEVANTLSWLAQVVALLNCVRDVTVSNLCRDTYCHY